MKKGTLPHSLTALAISAVLFGCGDNKSTTEYLSSAQQHLTQENPAAAVIELKNALKQAPNDLPARLLLAEVYLQQRDGQAAAKELERAQKLGAPHVQVLIPMLKALALQNKHQALLDASYPQPGELDDDQRVMLHTLRGISQLHLGRTDEARLELAAATDIDPNTPMSRLGSAYNASVDNQGPKALTILNQLLLEQPHFTEALELQARLSVSQGQHQSAINSYQTLIELHPKLYQYQLLQAEQYYQAGQVEEAEHKLKKLSRMFPKHLMIHLLLAEIAYQRREFMSAREYAGIAYAANSEHLPALLLLGLTNAETGRHDLAKDQLQKVSARLPSNHNAHKLIASALYKMGELHAADQVIDGLGSNSPQVSQMYEVIGSRMASEHNYDDAINVLEKALQHDPDNPLLQAKLGVAKLAVANESGLTDLANAIAQDPSLNKTRLSEALFYLKQGKTEQALAIAREWQAVDAQKLDGLNLEGQIWMEVNEPQKAVAFFNQVIDQDPGNMIALNHLSYIASHNGQPQQALKYQQQLLIHDPLNIMAHRRIAILQLMQDQPAQSQAHYQATLAAHPNAHAIRLSYANLLTKLERYEEAKVHLDQLTSVDEVKPRLFEVIAEHQIAQRQFDKAKQTYQRWINANASDSRPYFGLINLYRKQGDDSSVWTAIQQARQQFPTNEHLYAQEAQQALKMKKLEVAQKAIERVKASAVRQDIAYDLESQLMAARGQYQQASNLLEAAHHAVPDGNRVLRLAKLYSLTEQHNLAVSLLRDWLAQHPSSTPARSFLAMILQGQNQTQAAVKEYRQLLAANPDNLLALNNLSWLLATKGEYAEASRLIKVAVKQAPDSPDILDTYGYILLQQQQSSEALPILEKAANLAPSHPTINYHFAQALSANGKTQAAVKALNIALASAPHFPERKEATQLLKSLQAKQ